MHAVLMILACGLACGIAAGAATNAARDTSFEGQFIAGRGDREFLQLLETCYQLLYPSAELPNLGMLYTPAWHGFVEGPTWGAWWIQNSYGPTYCGLPFFQEPYATYVAKAQELWFSQMGDGKRKGSCRWHCIAPDGCLCDAAAPGWIVYKQGDGRVEIHDWGMEFTAAGLLLQAELLLISRDPEAIALNLPRLRRCAAFIESRRDPQTNCFWAGPAANLLAPSYAGYKRPDGSYGWAYLTGLSITYIAALERLIELEKLAGNVAQAELYEHQREAARQGLARLTTEEGYFIKSLDPDGTRHGVYGAPQHGYFEAVCNHDAIAFRVADQAQAERIYAKIASLPGLRPHGLIITNYPSLDDMYTEPQGLWEFGRWVNGGHWTTCEARMILAYFRLGKYADAQRAMQQLLRFARDFRFDNPLTEFGNAVYQPQEPINIVYDSWGGPLAMLRGLFEYLYRADRLLLYPHIPSQITALEQRFPVRFGTKRLYLRTCGVGPVTAVYVNRQPWRLFDGACITLPYARLPQEAEITICLGGAKPPSSAFVQSPAFVVPPPADPLWEPAHWWHNLLGNGQPLRVGADSRGGTRFVGAMRRVRVWPRALTPEEIKRLAEDANATLEEGGLIDLDFAEAKAGRCPNRAQPDLPAKIVGEIAFDEEAQAGGRIALFDGRGFLEIPPDPRLTLTEAYTLEAWIRPETLPDTGARIIDRVTAGVDDGYLLDTFPKDSLRLITEHGHLGYAARLQPGKWAHVAATFARQAGLRLYLNGQLVAERRPEPAPATGRSFAAIGTFLTKARAAGLGETAEAKQAELIVRHLAALRERLRRQEAGTLARLPEPRESAAQRAYIQAAERLQEGLQRLFAAPSPTDNPQRKRLADIWAASLAAASKQ